MQTSGKCRLPPPLEAVHKDFNHTNIPVGHENDHYYAVQLSSQYVQCVYDEEDIRKALINFQYDDLDVLNAFMHIYKCVAVHRSEFRL